MHGHGHEPVIIIVNSAMRNAFFIYFRSIALLSASAILFFGCAFRDPSRLNLAPKCYDKGWKGPDTPPCIIDIATEELEEAIPDYSEALEPAEIVDIALKNNPQTQKTWFQARSNAFLYGASHSTLYPTITGQETISLTKSTVGASIGGTNNSNIVTGQTAINNPTAISTAAGAAGTAASAARSGSGSGSFYEQNLISSISVSYLMLDFGGREAAIEAAKQTLFSSNWTHNRNIQTVMVNALTAYFNYLSSRAQFNAQLKNVEDARKTMEATRVQYEVGVSPRVDFLQASSNFVNAEMTLEMLRGQTSITMGQLANAMGIPANTPLNVGAPQEELPYEKLTKDMDSLIEIAKNQRPDLKASYTDYRQTWANLQSARSAGLPTLTANGMFERVNFIHDPAFSGNFAQGQVSLNVPIFNGFLYYYNTKSARELVDASWAQLRTQEETVFLDVVTSYHNFKTALETVKYSEKYVAYAQEAFNVAYAGYRQGVNSIIDLLNAQVTLANARFTQIQARSQLEISLVSIAYATGVLYN